MGRVALAAALGGGADTDLPFLGIAVSSCCMLLIMKPMPTTGFNGPRKAAENWNFRMSFTSPAAISG